MKQRIQIQTSVTKDEKHKLRQVASVYDLTPTELIRRLCLRAIDDAFAGIDILPEVQGATTDSERIAERTLANMPKGTVGSPTTSPAKFRRSQ